MLTYEGLRLKLLHYWRIGLADYRRKQLKSTDFTIISNNCWGGMIYEVITCLSKRLQLECFLWQKIILNFYLI